jgi:hypothetical protein
MGIFKEMQDLTCFDGKVYAQLLPLSGISRWLRIPLPRFQIGGLPRVLTAPLPLSSFFVNLAELKLVVKWQIKNQVILPGY